MNLKEKILIELWKKEFPDLKLLFSEEVLDISLELLDELLEKEKKDFDKLLKIENKDLTFESFENESFLDYFWSLLNHLENVNSSEKCREIIESFRPKLQDFSNEVSYSKELFEKYVYVKENLELDEEQKRIMYLRVKSFTDRWIDLPVEKQNRIKEINKKLWELSDKFTNNIVDDEKTFEYLITDFEIIKDLPTDVLEIAKEAYINKTSSLNSFSLEEKEVIKKSFSNNPPSHWGEGGRGWGWLFDADPTSNQALMKYCHSQKVREDISRASYTTASNWKYDNRQNVIEILKLKDEKAKILWYKNYAELSLNSKMADSPEQIFELLESTSSKAKQKAYKDIDELKEYFNLEKIESYDLAYYSRIYKEEKYNIDEKEIKKYFEFENVLDYLFNFVQKFYSVEIKEIKIDSYNPDIRVYEIYKNNELISYYFLDAFYRKTKRPWAWADNLRSKEYFPETKVPVILNVCNFQKSNSWKTTLYLRDVETLFHEFWHALHELLSESKYSELSWFWVERDFVELPSQLLENWVWEKESIKKLSKHIETWESLSDEMIEKFEKLKHYMSWVFVARQNEFSLLDMTLYSSEVPNSIEELDKKTLEIVNIYSIFPRSNDYKMYCSFNHIFWGWYAAGYYSYMWAEIIEADVFERIKEMWMFDSKTWEKLLKTIIGQWTRKKASELFFDFMWREVDNSAFMKRYWI